MSQFSKGLQIWLILMGMTFVKSNIISGEVISQAKKCKTNCIDQGGTFCKSFGELTTGYCCYSSMAIPCDQRSQQCSSTNNEITKYFSCPFEDDICGTHAIEVSDEIQEFEVYNTEFKNFTFCQYQFRAINSIRKQINIKIIFAGNRLKFTAMHGQTLQKGTNVKVLSSSQLYMGDIDDRVYLLAQSINASPDSFKIQHYLTTPQEQELPPAVKPNATNSSTNTSVIANPVNSTNSTLNETQNEETQVYYAGSGDDSSGSGGTAIVIIIAVLIVIIPLGFIISCIVKKIRERRMKNAGQDDMIPLPDHSQHPSSPDYRQSNNLYPFNSPIDDSENMQSVMQAIQNAERNQYGGGGGFGNGPEPIQFIEIPGRSGDMITIPVDQLPPFLQDMAQNDPEIFNHVMSDMDEEKLEQFIKEQEDHIIQQQQQNNNEILHSEMGLNQMNLVDPLFINEQQEAFQRAKKQRKKRDNNFMMDPPPSDLQDGEELKLPPIDQHRQHINLDENDNQNLDMLVSGMGLSEAAAQILEQPKQKKKSKKKKKRRNPIEVIEDANNITPDEQQPPMVFEGPNE